MSLSQPTLADERVLFAVRKMGDFANVALFAEGACRRIYDQLTGLESNVTDVTLANAKAHLSELVSRVALGDSVRITRRGKPIAQLSQVAPPRARIDLGELQALTMSMPLQPETAAETVRSMRDGERY